MASSGLTRYSFHDSTLASIDYLDTIVSVPRRLNCSQQSICCEASTTLQIHPNPGNGPVTSRQSGTMDRQFRENGSTHQKSRSQNNFSHYAYPTATLRSLPPRPLQWRQERSCSRLANRRKPLASQTHPVALSRSNHLLPQWFLACLAQICHAGLARGVLLVQTQARQRRFPPSLSSPRYASLRSCCAKLLFHSSLFAPLGQSVSQLGAPEQSANASQPALKLAHRLLATCFKVTTAPYWLARCHDGLTVSFPLVFGGACGLGCRQACAYALACFAAVRFFFHAITLHAGCLETFASS
ncbi:hypothetical protein IWZ03DRAFT_237088 [Phyllosticta citriasiana]|uniref:Uncharacterized protein n=1 Tax=Phyllosticta citriasiana TaxID=595635 RepID=A0ABR1KEY7_9PEZI